MKPISLVIDGVNSFYDRQEIDFRFDGLFCICGDTGSGKTTILDCIIIALFGSGNRALLNDYINLRRDKNFLVGSHRSIYCVYGNISANVKMYNSMRKYGKSSQCKDRIYI